MNEIKVGDYVKSVLKKRGFGWNVNGKMDYLLQGKHKVVDAVHNRIYFKDMYGRRWICSRDEFIKVKRGVII